MCPKLALLAVLLLGSGAFSVSQVTLAAPPDSRPWQRLIDPTVGEAAANFKASPREYGAIQPFASWYGADLTRWSLDVKEGDAITKVDVE